MKRIRFVLTAVAGAVLVAWLSGCGKPKGQETEARTYRARDMGVAPVGAKEAAEVADSRSNGPVALTLSVETNQEEGVAAGQPGDLGTLTLSKAMPSAGGIGNVTRNPRVTFVLPDGSTYDGEVIGDKPNGWGTFTDPRGTHQQGEWRHGDPYQVTGTWVSPDGTIEVGTWNADGTQSGGTITWKDGRQYKGDWELVGGGTEQPSGSGEMRWPDGRQYVGRFRDGKMEGKGRMTYPDGKVEDGWWEQDKLVEAAR